MSDRAADRPRKGALALHDVAGRVRRRAEPRDGLDDDRDLLPSGPGRGVCRDHRRGAGRSERMGRLPGPRRRVRGAWKGPIFVLTHHPEDAMPTEGVTFVNCDPGQAVQIALEAAGGKNLEVFSPTIGRQLLERGRIDEIDLHIAAGPVGRRDQALRHPRSRTDPSPPTRGGRSRVGGRRPVPTSANRATQCQRLKELLGQRARPSGPPRQPVTGKGGSP